MCGIDAKRMINRWHLLSVMPGEVSADASSLAKLRSYRNYILHFLWTYTSVRQDITGYSVANSSAVNHNALKMCPWQK